MTRVHAPLPSRTNAAHGVIQRKCASCSQALARAPCPDCAKKKQAQLSAYFQTRLQVSTPGDAGEGKRTRGRRGMEGRAAQVANSNPPTLQRQDMADRRPPGAALARARPARGARRETAVATQAAQARQRQRHAPASAVPIRPNRTSTAISDDRWGATVTSSVTTTSAGRGRVRSRKHGLGGRSVGVPGAGTFTRARRISSTRTAPLDASPAGSRCDGPSPPTAPTRSVKASRNTARISSSPSICPCVASPTASMPWRPAAPRSPANPVPSARSCAAPRLRRRSGSASSTAWRARRSCAIAATNIRPARCIVRPTRGCCAFARIS